MEKYVSAKVNEFQLQATVSINHRNIMLSRKDKPQKDIQHMIHLHKFPKYGLGA